MIRLINLTGKNQRLPTSININDQYKKNQYQRPIPTIMYFTLFPIKNKTSFKINHPIKINHNYILLFRYLFLLYYIFIYIFIQISSIVFLLFTLFKVFALLYNLTHLLLIIKSIQMGTSCVTSNNN
jgi:hypothetical protein